MNDNEQKQKPHLFRSPSFGEESRQSLPDDLHSGDEDSSDFEFEFSIGSTAARSGGDPADDIFSNGRILPVYPVFNRNLLEPGPVTEELRSGSASSTSSAESVAAAAEAAGEYCAWVPRSAPQSPDRAAWKKSSSTGSDAKSGAGSSKKWKTRDLVGGRRSHSDGKEKLVEFSSDPKPHPKPSSNLKKGEMDLVTAHRLFYGKDKKAAEKGNGKRSFLPYKPELMGLFANSRAHHHHPFNI